MSEVTSGLGRGLGEPFLLQNSLSEAVSADQRPTSGAGKEIDTDIRKCRLLVEEKLKHRVQKEWIATEMRKYRLPMVFRSEFLLFSTDIRKCRLPMKQLEAWSSKEMD